MGWAVGYDDNWNRDIGYGVPAECDSPDCNKQIDRGLAYVCGGAPYGGDKGCGLYFCDQDLFLAFDAGSQLCMRCTRGEDPFTPKPDAREWVQHKLTHDSWAQWRSENPSSVEAMKESLDG